MATIASGAPPRELDAAEPRTIELVGGPSFSDLVRAHYKWEKGRKSRNGAASLEAEEEYKAKLADFQDKEGTLQSIYWSTQNASAVALTIGNDVRSKRNPFAETDMRVELHRVTDWVTKNAEEVAELLHECDTLAIRAREILRGTTQRITLQLIYSVEEHVLGYIERSDRERNAKDEKKMVASERAELARIEKYYLRSGAKAGRIVYATGMLVGAALIVAICAGVAVLLKHPFNYWTGHKDAQYLVLCTGAGAVGALVSVLSRMSSGDNDRFSIDFEVGRPLLRRLGLYKPFVGSVFGVATYFLLAGGLLPTTSPNGNRLYFYGIIAFLAGFSERFTGVIFGKAEQFVGGAEATGQQQAQQ
jgi:hypothetical protein